MTDYDLTVDPLPRRVKIRRLGLIVVGIVAAGAAAVTAALLSSGPSPVRIPRDDLRIGVTYMEIASREIFVVDLDGRIEVFLARSTHRGAPVVWCDPDPVFIDAYIGSRWDVHGRLVQGPAPRDLDRLHFTTEPGVLVVHPGSIIQGPSRPKIKHPQQIPCDERLGPPT